MYTDSFESLQKIEREKVKLTGKIKKHAPVLSDRYDSQFPSDRIGSHFEIGSAALIAGMTNVLTLRVDTLGVTYKELGIQKHVHALGHNDPGISSNGWDGLRCRMEIEKLHLKHIASRKATARCSTTRSLSTCPATAATIMVGKPTGCLSWSEAWPTN